MNTSVQRILIVLVACIATSVTAFAQVRGKRPDRSTYQPPTLEGYIAKSKLNEPLVPITVELPPVAIERSPSNSRGQSIPGPVIDRRYTNSISGGVVRQVGHEEILSPAPTVSGPTLAAPEIFNSPIQSPAPHPILGEQIHSSLPVMQGSCSCDQCLGACDSIGCDSMGCRSGRCGGLGLRSGNWFGSIDLLLMFRRGDRPPPLVTTGPSTDPDTAGQIGDIGTTILVGGDSILRDVTAGGRLELGLWLDQGQHKSVVFRGWFAGEEVFNFNGSQNEFDVLGRPIVDVSDGQVGVPDVQLVVFPNETEGTVSVRGESEVFGADISIRRLTHGQFGGTIDVLYGYQFMRVDESLQINTTAMSLSDDNTVITAPLGAVQSLQDRFATKNEFHGGQIGFSTLYRENCWSFRSLFKTGFGSLKRTAILTGETTTSIDGVSSTDSQGLLVRNTNSGRFSDSTFAWAPELDFTLGWQKYPNFDVTVGYHIIGLTDALQPSGTIDPTLAVNASDPLVGAASPQLNLDFRTFYVQGVHFGLQYVY